MAIEYGTIAIVPKGEWDSGTQYEVANLVTRDGSSFLAHTKPPVGTLPTNTAYWQVSAQGTSKATAGSVGTVKPDGVTTEVSADGTLSAKTATQSTAGMVKGSTGITVGTGGALDVNTAFTQATELANIIAGEAISQVLGKISKSIAVTIGLDQNALLKNMLTNMDANDSTKINSSAFVHTLVERIGMGTSLTAGANLTAVVESLNSDLALKANSSDLISKADKTDLKYQIIDLAGADLVTLPAGRWTVNNGVANGESGGWFAEVVEFDDAYRTLFACPYDDTKKYFYRAKRVFGTWRGWEKYTSVL